MKQVVKLKGLLMKNVDPEFQITLEIKDLGKGQVRVQGESLFDFLEFICFHPSMEKSKEARGRYYDQWLKRTSAV